MTGTDKGLWSTSNCGDLTEPAGTVAYWYADAWSSDDRGRRAATLDGTQGGLTAAQTALLEERLGPPVVVGVTFADHAIARFHLWKWHGLGLLAVGVGAIVWLRRRRNLSAAEASTAQ